MYFLIISGMSGAGKSRAVATLEDLGYYCVDNLPIALIAASIVSLSFAGFAGMVENLFR